MAIIHGWLQTLWNTNLNWDGLQKCKEHSWCSMLCCQDPDHSDHVTRSKSAVPCQHPYSILTIGYVRNHQMWWWMWHPLCRGWTFLNDQSFKPKIHDVNIPPYFNLFIYWYYLLICTFMINCSENDANSHSNFNASCCPKCTIKCLICL